MLSTLSLVLQQYFAGFKITQALHSIPGNLYPNEDMSLRPSLVVAHLAFEFYIADMVQLINDGATAAITSLKASNNPVERQAAEKQQADLNVWLKEDQPFNYDNYLPLCRAISTTITRLPPASEVRLVMKQFMTLLVTASKQKPKNTVPFIKGGYFQHVLPIAIKTMEQLAQAAGLDVEEHVVHALSHAWKAFNIHAIPWTPPRPANITRGAQQSVIVYNAFINFGAVQVRTITNWFRPEERRNAEMEANRDKTMASDADAPWIAGEVKLQDLKNILNRHHLPDDFKNPEFNKSSEAVYVEETYRFVRNVFDAAHPLHHLALIAGIVFSRITPNVFVEKPTSVSPRQLATHDSTAQYLKSLPWVNKKKKGLAQRDIFITMIMTLIIGLYEPTSPLRSHISKSPKKGLGTLWTDKHGKPFL